MWQLAKSELIRFRTLALGFGLAHLLALRALALFTDLLEPRVAKLAVGLVLYTLGGLILGLYQLGSYKKANQWAYLIHRPLAPSRIFLALAGAAAVVLLLTVALPWWLVTAYLDAVTPRYVDLRHYGQGLFLFGTALAFYLAGAIVMLNRSRVALLLALTPMFFLTWHAVGLWIFLPQLVVILWLGYVAYASFKPDLTTFVDKPLHLAATALPLQIVFLLVLAGASALAHQTFLVFQEHGVKSYAVHNWAEYFPEGTYDHLTYLQNSGRDTLAHGLATTDTEEARYLRRQLPLAAEVTISPSLKAAPPVVRHQLPWVDRHQAFPDEDPEVRWRFSHDRMLFQGLNARTGASVGWLGATGLVDPGSDEGEAARFQAVPVVLGKGFLLADRTLYGYDMKHREVTPRFALAEGERVLGGPVRHGSFLALLTDRSLYFFDPRDLETEPGLLTPTAAAELPGEARNLGPVHIVELLDSYLLSFSFGERSYRGYAEAYQVVAELPMGGSYQAVTERRLDHGFGSLYRYRAFVASPLLDALWELTWSAIGPRRWNRYGLSDLSDRTLPSRVIWAALAVALLSAVFVFWLAGRRGLSPARQRGWALVALLAGAPGVLSFLFLTPRRERVVEARSTGVSSAAVGEAA